MIELVEVSKQFDSILAVDALSIRVEEGRICGFLGPNGAGKTTAIRMLMNIIHPDKGTILFDGSEQRPPAHRIGYLPEERGLYQKISVYETLQYFARLRKVQDAHQKITSYLKRFDLEKRLGSKVNELSKGNQQKLQFINTILHNPQYVVLDEPFSGLDPVNQILLKEILEELKAAGRTIIFSSHQMDQVEKVCDDVALIDQGKMILAGKMNEIKMAHGTPQLQITPQQDSDLEHPFFTDQATEIRTGSAYFSLTDIDKQKLIERANAQFDLRSVKITEPGLEEIFIDLIRGASK
ncbi:MAG: ATP-binding cassette domain-containing protein [Candidatus Marinimicrobia bacterium]|nr:ATP-binding cassette domain-containing protein [Candidatus Neomarinimicrobiota bacterium]